MKPDPNKKYPIEGYEKEIYVKTTISNPVMLNHMLSLQATRQSLFAKDLTKK